MGGKDIQNNIGMNCCERRGLMKANNYLELLFLMYRNIFKVLSYTLIILLIMFWYLSVVVNANPGQPTIPYNSSFRISEWPGTFYVVNGKVEYQGSDGYWEVSFSGDLYDYNSTRGYLERVNPEGTIRKSIFQFSFQKEGNIVLVEEFSAENYASLNISSTTWELISTGSPATKPESSSPPPPSDPSTETEIDGIQPDGSGLSPGDIQLITPPPASDPPSTPTENGTPATSPPSNYSSPASGPGLSGPGERIPDGALPIATGAIAALAALGALGVVATNGVPAAQILDEIQSFLNGKQAQHGGTRSVHDIMANPCLHDQVTDVDGKKWIYYHRPGDLAGDGWTPLDEYEHAIKQQSLGKIWSDRWGWVTLEEQKNYEANRQKAEQKFNEESDDLLKKLVESDKRIKEFKDKEKAERIREEEENTIRNIEKLEDRMGNIIKEKIEEGYFVRNTGLLKKAWNNSIGLVVNEWAGGWKGGQCGQYGEWGMEWSKDAVHEIFGEKAIITDISASNNRFLGHRATKVILPDGRRVVLDYWEGMPKKGKQKIYSEEEWIEKWNKKLWGDYLGKAQVDRHPDELNLKQYISDWGEEIGINKFRAYQSGKNGTEYADIFIRSWEKSPW
jgi:hypothetical protein